MTLDSYKECSFGGKRSWTDWLSTNISIKHMYVSSPIPIGFQYACNLICTIHLYTYIYHNKVNQIKSLIDGLYGLETKKSIIWVDWSG